MILDLDYNSKIHHRDLNLLIHCYNNQGKYFRN